MLTWKKTLTIALLAITTAIGVPLGSKASLITNGGFESNTGSGQIDVTTSATGWYIDPGADSSYTFLFGPGTADTSGANGQYGSLGLWGPNNGSNNGLPATSPAGGYYIAQDSDFQNAAIQQTITGLTPGQSYNVGFYWAAAQQYGFDGPNSSGWQVSLGSDTQSTGLESIPSHGFSGWMYSSLTLTADNSTDVLSFFAYGGPPVPPFALLDGVTLDPANSVPAPSNLIMSLVLLGMFGSVWAYKRINPRVAAN